MHTTDPTLWPAVEQARAIRERRLGSEELLDLFLDRIERADPVVRAVCTLDVHAARLRCRAADDAVAAGEWWGPLHGLPITVKDAIVTAGIRSTGGAVELRDHVPAVDAPAVAALKAAGAVVFGKTNLPEWSGDWQSYNDMFGTTTNPWGAQRTAGGSSGGAAAAVACGMTSFELGTDIGGSVRVPSSFCGVFGHKPTFGIIPTLGYLDEPGAMHPARWAESDVNTFGPIARSAEDLRLLLDVLAGPGPDRAAAWRLQLPDRDIRSLRGLRVGAWIDEPAMEVDAVLARVLHRAVDAVEDAGAHVDRTIRPAVDVAAEWRNGARLIGAAVSVHGDGPTPSHRDWLRMHRDRGGLRAAWAEVFERVDVLLCPVTLLPAFDHLQDGIWSDRTIQVNGVTRPYYELEAWPAIVGAAYLPSTATPVGVTDDGFPVGVQVVAPHLGDLLSIQVSALVAEVCAEMGGSYRAPTPTRE
ncbi:MAG: amidase family protein [Ilumatobacteraceae bacterium]